MTFYEDTSIYFEHGKENLKKGRYVKEPKSMTANKAGNACHKSHFDDVEVEIKSYQILACSS